MLIEIEASKHPREDKEYLARQIAYHVQLANKYIADGKAYRAYFHVAAGQHILDCSDSGRYIDTIPGPMLMLENITLLDLMAELAAQMSLMCGVISSKYDPQERMETAIMLWQRLFEKNEDPIYKEKRARLIEQHLAPSQELFRKGELLDYFQKAKPLERYDVYANDEDEILIVVPKDIELPRAEETPILYYDGGEHGLLFKNDNAIVVCDFIHEGARESLFKQPRALVMELHEPVTEYMVDVVAAPGTGVLIEEILNGCSHSSGY